MRRQNAIEHSPKVFESRRRDRFPSSIEEFIALGRTRNRCTGLDDVEGPQIRADQSTALACRDHKHFGRYSTRSLGALPEDPRFWRRLHRCILLLVSETERPGAASAAFRILLSCGPAAGGLPH